MDITDFILIIENFILILFLMSLNQSIMMVASKLKNYTSSVGYEDFSTGNVSTYSFSNNYVVPYLELIKSDIFEMKIISEFRKRSLLPEIKSDNYAKSRLEEFRHNINEMRRKLRADFKSKDYAQLIVKNNKNYIETVNKLGIKQSHVSDIKFLQDKVLFTIDKDKNFVGNYDDLANLLSRLSFRDKRSIYLPKIQDDEHLFKYAHKPIDVIKGEVFKSPGLKIKAEYTKKKINIYQSKPSDWILFRNTNLNDWTINFVGNEKDLHKNVEFEQRFNKFGLTGCLNFFNSKFNKTKIFVKNGGCEDSLNIVNSIGIIDSISIYNAYSDAVDFDFSNLEVSTLNVNNANNDCVDVSGGNYNLNKVTLNNCGDKGISIGESYLLNAVNVNVVDSIIGVSSKDYSKATINTLNSKSEYCYQVYQKKQEFGGSFLKIDSMSCGGKEIVDDKSKVIIGYN